MKVNSSSNFQAAGSGRSRFRREAGQALVLMPMAILMICVFFAIGLNTAILGRQRVQIQEAVDSGALGGGRMQCLSLGFISMLNDIIAYKLAMAVKDIATAFDDPAEIIDALEDLAADAQCVSIQGDVQTASQLFTQIGAFGMSVNNGATLGFALPPASGSFEGISLPGQQYFESSEPRIEVTRGFWTVWIFDTRGPNTDDDLFSGFYMWEKPVVIAFAGNDVNLSQTSVQQPMPVPIIGDLSLKAPWTMAMSAARDYWIPWGDPLNLQLDADENGVLGKLTPFISLMLPGPWWGSRLDEVGVYGWEQWGAGMAVSLANYFAGKGVSYFEDQIKNQLKEGAQDLEEETDDEIGADNEGDAGPFPE